MKKNIISIASMVMTVLLISTNSFTLKAENPVLSNISSNNTKVLDVDDVLVKAESLVGKSVTVEGVCTHICSHGGKKLFIKGSDDSKVIRVQAGQLGSFDASCINNMLTIIGEVKEDRIDEAYLAKWEATTKESEAKEEDHHSCGSCSKEKSTPNAKSNSTLDKIADYRQQISERVKSEGKAYLSYFYVEATKYSVK